MKKLALLVALSTLIATVLYWRQLAVRIAPDALLPDGSRYQGQIVNGRFEGRGQLLFGNGEGEIQYANGDHYRGNISFLFEEGHGTLRYANGDVYEGEFSSDSQHGKGVLIFANNEKDEQDKKGEKGESRIEGTWSWGDNPDDSRQKKQQKIATEERFYQQPALIQQRLSALAPEQAGQVDIYALTLAGDASSPVFLKELRLINTHLHTAGIDTEHLINLANDNETAEMWPMANGSALSRVLSGLAERMNPDEDVLLLYMTSHGSAQHALHIDTPGADSPNISAQRLANMLDTLPLKHTILIISACYSGGFIDQLKNDDNLVISAARHDRKSFGCGDDNDMTYFGRAYFAHGIGQGLGFVAAFHNATQLVEEWEDKNFPDQPHSEPQIHVGEKMRALLEKQKRL